MNVLFLDFDGVLNTVDHNPVLPPPPFRPEPMSLDWLAYQLNPVLCNRVTRIAEQSGAALVLSTTWRNRFPLPRLATLMGSLGMPMPAGSTPLLPGGSREMEIKHWLQQASPMRWCVLDDDELHIDHLVQTNDHISVSDEDVERCLQILRSNS